MNSVLPIQKKYLSILFFGTQIATGGAQKVLLDQADWFQNQGHKVTVVFFYDRENLHDKWQNNVRFPIYVLTSYRKQLNLVQSVLEVVKGLKKLWKLFHKEKFDVIESFTHDSNIISIPLAWLAHIPVRLATHHGLVTTFSRWRIWLHTWIINLKMANTLIVVSKRTYQSAIGEGVYQENINLIKNGIEPISIESVDQNKVKKEAGLKNEDVFIVSVGRLVSEKAHEILIHAIPFVIKKHPNVKVGILGDGILRSQLQAEIENLKLTEYVHLLGMKEIVSEYLAIANIFVLPSRSEGLPIALLEAMSAGLPVIVTNLDGMSDVIEHGKHGLLVPSENPQAIADAILQLLENPLLARNLGAEGKKHIIGNYSKNTMAEQYLALMRSYLKPSRKNETR